MRIGIVALGISNQAATEGRGLRERGIVRGLMGSADEVHLFCRTPIDVNTFFNSKSNLFVHPINDKRNLVKSALTGHELIRRYREHQRLIGSTWPMLRGWTSRAVRLRAMHEAIAIERYTTKLDLDALLFETYEPLLMNIKTEVTTALDVHGVELEEAVAQGNIKKSQYFDARDKLRNLLSEMNSIIVMSAPMRNFLKDDYKVPESKMTVIPNASDPRPTRFPRSDTHEGVSVVFTGIFAYWEHVNDFITSAAILSRQETKLRFLLAGRGPELRSILQQMCETGSPVKYLGSLLRADALKLLDKSHIGVAPSSSDITRQVASPIKVYDYMAAGLPFVTVPIGEWSQMAETESCGLIAESNTPEAIAKCIRQMANNPSMRASMGRNGIAAIAARHNWDVRSELMFKTLQASC